MRLNISLPSILGTALLASLTACSDAGGSADPFVLMQGKDYAGAIAAFEPLLQTVEQGSSDHKELLLGHTEALCVESPDKARDSFLAAMGSSKDFLEPNDVTYVVNRMADHGHLLEAIDVMNKGKETWPEDEKIKVVLTELIAASQSSGDDAALAKLKSLGYL
jgi:hypothetical protein